MTLLTISRPIINPNTPNSRLAWLFTAATPMNSIMAAKISPVTDTSRPLRLRTWVWVGVADCRLPIAEFTDIGGVVAGVGETARLIVDLPRLLQSPIGDRQSDIAHCGAGT